MYRTTTLAALTLSLTFLLAGCAGKSGRIASAGGETPGAKGCCSDTGSWTHFGKKMKPAGGKPVCAGEILTDKSKYAGKLIRVCGKVASVCAHKGCWIRLAGSGTDETLFVKFTCPVKGRLVPMEAMGKLAVVEGTLELKEISEEEARHYAEDKGTSPEDIAKIVGPQKVIKLSAPAAKIDLQGPTTSAG